MTLYQISYDLEDPGRVYEELYEAIRALGDCIRLLESTWILDVSEYESSDIRYKLKKHIGSNDKILVTEFSRPWTTTFTNSDTEWLREHL